MDQINKILTEQELEELLVEIFWTYSPAAYDSYRSWYVVDKVKQMYEQNSTLCLTSSCDYIRKLAEYFHQQAKPDPTPLTDIYPLTIIRDRYGGAYSGGDFLAFNLDANDVPLEATGGDIACSEFFDEPPVPVGIGNTFDSAIENLAHKLNKEN